MTQIHELGALELGKKIADREISAPEAVRHALGRMDLLDSTVNALITISGRSAYQQAKAIQKRLDAGEKLPPLAGVPLAVQDNISTKDILTTCASRMLHNYVPPFSATVIDRLVAAGGIVIGKTNLGEFAMDGTNETSHFGPVLNRRPIIQVIRWRLRAAVAAVGLVRLGLRYRRISSPFLLPLRSDRPQANLWFRFSLWPCCQCFLP